MRAQREAINRNRSVITPQHIFLGLMGMPNIEGTLDQFGVNLPRKLKAIATAHFLDSIENSKTTPTEKPELGNMAKNVIFRAVEEANQMGGTKSQITSLHILMGLLIEKESFAPELLVPSPLLDQLRSMPPPKKSTPSV